MNKQLVARQTPALNQTINLVRNTCDVVGMIVEEDKNMNLEGMKSLNIQSTCIMESCKAICNDDTATLDEKRQSIAEMKEQYNTSVQVNKDIIKEKRSRTRCI